MLVLVLRQWWAMGMAVSQLPLWAQALEKSHSPGQTEDLGLLLEGSCACCAQGQGSEEDLATRLAVRCGACHAAAVEERTVAPATQQLSKSALWRLPKSAVWRLPRSACQ